MIVYRNFATAASVGIVLFLPRVAILDLLGVSLLCIQSEKLSLWRTRWSRYSRLICTILSGFWNDVVEWEHLMVQKGDLKVQIRSSERQVQGDKGLWVDAHG